MIMIIFINSRWAWGRCLERMMFEPQAQKPSMQGNHDNPAHEQQPQGIVTPQKSAKWCLSNTYHREGGGAGSEVAEHSQNGPSTQEQRLTSTAEL